MSSILPDTKWPFYLLFTNGAILSHGLLTSQVKLVLNLMLIRAEISCISTNAILTVSWSWFIISPWEKLIACKRPMIGTHNEDIFHNIANVDILLGHIQVKQSTFPSGWSILWSWAASFQQNMPKSNLLMLLDGNVAMDIETHLILQHYQHLQFQPKTDTILRCSPVSSSQSQLTKEKS